MSSAHSTALGGLIAVSGIDGSGKSTLVSAFAQSLRSSGASVEAVAALKSPQFSPFTLLKGINFPSAAKPSRESWIAGYFALVLLHNVSAVIAPAIAAGTWVVTDRWTLDHHAIQLTLGIDMAPWLPLLKSAPTPDLHLILDLPPEIAQQRIDKRGDQGIGAGLQYLQQCRDKMQSLATSPDYAPVVLVDADASPADLRDRVLEATRDVMSGRLKTMQP
ncbi:hypothetical protein A5658_04565 [Mycobacterium sp. 1245111.1]|uniref:dTMP kinase n=1 Tax=Mycobacterium sp. 1245111.1 TaxID=1834073 RepID=UPI0007FCCFD8|nr:dTMP kinase [Mycobacterium sp. 1245111.1]OBK37155.1 hypothetical protein A5658_04565 [Mycobacterium sp. 1245111.1]